MERSNQIMKSVVVAWLISDITPIAPLATTTPLLQGVMLCAASVGCCIIISCWTGNSTPVNSWFIALPLPPYPTDTPQHVTGCPEAQRSPRVPSSWLANKYKCKSLYLKHCHTILLYFNSSVSKLDKLKSYLLDKIIGYSIQFPQGIETGAFYFCFLF